MRNLAVFIPFFRKLWPLVRWGLFILRNQMPLELINELMYTFSVNVLNIIMHFDLTFTLY